MVAVRGLCGLRLERGWVSYAVPRFAPAYLTVHTSGWVGAFPTLRKVEEEKRLLGEVGGRCKAGSGCTRPDSAGDW